MWLFNKSKKEERGTVDTSSGCAICKDGFRKHKRTGKSDCYFSVNNKFGMLVMKDLSAFGYTYYEDISYCPYCGNKLGGKK